PLRRTAVDDHVQTIERAEQALRLADRYGELLDLRVRFRAPGRDSVEAPRLVGRDQAAFGVIGHRDPRTLRTARDAIEPFDAEPRGNAHLLGRRGQKLVGLIKRDAAPRPDSPCTETHRLSPAGRWVVERLPVPFRLRRRVPARVGNDGYAGAAF